MKSSRLILIFVLLSSVGSSAVETQPGISLLDTRENLLPETSSGRWQLLDRLNVRITIDWQVDLLTKRIITEFRTNLVAKGFWHGFGLSASSPPDTTGIIYALQWQRNDSEISWNIYDLTESNLTVLERNNHSDVTFQRSFSSGLLTVRSTSLMNNASAIVDGQHCLSIVYFRGRVLNDRALMPEERRDNRSLCFSSVQRKDWTSTGASYSTEEQTRALTENDSTTEFSDRISTMGEWSSTNGMIPLVKKKTEVNLFWIGRISNRIWFDDYSNFSSLRSNDLRLQLQNLFVALLHSHSSMICTRFDLYSLQPGSILFAVKVGLLSDRSVNETVDVIDERLRSLNSTLAFDRTRHYIQPVLDESQFVILFERVPSSTNVDDLRNSTDIDLALHLLLGSIVSFTCLIIIITTLLCLYGYYKCQRRQFRLFAEQETLKVQAERNAYAWLGQQPTVDSSSSPYLIQSTSI